MRSICSVCRHNSASLRQYRSVVPRIADAGSVWHRNGQHECHPPTSQKTACLLLPGKARANSSNQKVIRQSGRWREQLLQNFQALINFYHFDKMFSSSVLLPKSVGRFRSQSNISPGAPVDADCRKSNTATIISHCIEVSTCSRIIPLARRSKHGNNRRKENEEIQGGVQSRLVNLLVHIQK